MSQIKTFSESWYRVANIKVCLRSSIKVHKQVFQGQEWYVLNDTFNNQYFRLKPDAYHFVARLKVSRTVEETWKEAIELFPETAPGQEDVMQLLTQLHVSNMLYYNSLSDNEHFFQRYQKRKQKEFRAQLMSIMFLKIPLLDPDAWLKRILPYTRFMFTYVGAALWFSIVIFAIKLVFDNFDQVVDQGNAILAPSNLILLYLGMGIIKTLHELGHSLVCRHYGGEVHTLGIMLIIFVPLPYMDATSSWSFRNRWHRIFVGAAGMITELFIAAIATIIWVNTAPGTVNSLAYNMMFVASVSTLLFNANPLLRFDGYFMLSHFLDIPNLYSRAQKQVYHLSEKYILGTKDSRSVAINQRENFWLPMYAIISTIYRLFIFTGIILFIANEYLILGLLMAVFMLVTWLIMPPFMFIKYLLTNPVLEKNRKQAITISAGIFVTLLLLLAVVPFPDRFRSPGIIESEKYINVTTGTAGYISEIMVSDGSMVKSGDALLRLDNWNLSNQLAFVDAQLEETTNQEVKSRTLQIADMAPLLKRKQALKEKKQELEQQQEALIIRAQQDGKWVAPQAKEMLGTWVARGAAVGMVLDESKFRFVAVISQEDASNLFKAGISDVEVKMHGEAVRTLTTSDFDIIPYDQKQLPSPALGWHGGGDIPVSQQQDKQGESKDPFFRIQAKINATSSILALHGRSGQIRINTGMTPLLWQWERSLRQLLQDRFQV